MDLSERLWQGRLLPSALGACLAAGYNAGLRVREKGYKLQFLKTRPLDIPVLSVGNLTVGGTGKTPVVMALARLLSGHYRVAVVSRGYRRSSSEDPLVVSDGTTVFASPLEGGDEPCLMAKELQGVSVVVGSNRYQAASLAVERLGAQVVLLDDGFQNRQLKKTLDLLLVDAQSGFGNGRLLPAGPLREPLEAMKRADAVALVRKGKVEPDPGLLREIEKHAANVPLFTLNMGLSGFSLMDGGALPLDEVRGKNVVAFCGIGNPKAFFRVLEECGMNIVERLVFPDHHRYSLKDIVKIADFRRKWDDPIFVTTAKDAVKMPGPPSLPGLLVAHLSVELPEGLVEIVKRAVESYYSAKRVGE